MHNRVTVFSNGIVDYRRSVAVGGGENKTVEIPVNRNYIGDILASLNVYGPVTLISPPSFTPSNQAAGKLEINPEDFVHDVGKKLVGAKVQIRANHQDVDGTLAGLHSEERSSGGEATRFWYFSIFSGGKLKNIPVTYIEEITFEPSVQVEIDKALRRRLESLKPQVAFVNLGLSSENGGEAVIHYTIPAAAWKMSYRLREVGDGMALEGFAIVDNNTEEDWNDVLISVVTGEPITFNTDLATSKLPQRSSVNVVADQAIGAVEPERGYAVMAAAAVPRGLARNAPLRSFAGSSKAMDFMGAEGPEGEEGVACRSFESAFQANTEIKEVGDFSIFESNSPMSISAGQSATFPVFVVDLDDARGILFYKQSNHAERPFRAIKFKNGSGYALGRGICTVYQKDIYAGSCVIPACKKGEERMLCHALETGVRIKRSVRNNESRTSRVRISEGIAVVETRHSCETVYRVSSNKEEQFNLVIDHDKTYGEDTSFLAFRSISGASVTVDSGIAVEPSQTLKNGVRFDIPVQPQEEYEFVVKEWKTSSQGVNIGINTGYGTDWLLNTVGDNNILENETVSECIKIGKALDNKDKEILKANKRLQTVSKKQDRAKDLLKSDSENRDWKNDLKKTEDEIRSLTETTIPSLEQEKQDLQNNLNHALQNIVYQSSTVEV